MVDWELLQTPGPTNIPESVRLALAAPGINHRSQEFSDTVVSAIAGLKRLAGAREAAVALYPSSGTGAWEAALMNSVAHGGTVLLPETGVFSERWGELAARLGYTVVDVAGSWESGADVEGVRRAIAADREHQITAVALVHSETSTGGLSDIVAVRQVLDDAEHPALLLVDAISSLGCAEIRHDEWGIDVTISGSQKALMLPPGLGINIISAKALRAAAQAANPNSYWRWDDVVGSSETGSFPYTPATHLIHALDVSLRRIFDEGVTEVYSRHDRMAALTRSAVRAWGLDTQIRDDDHASPSVTTVVTGSEVDVPHLLRVVKNEFGVELGGGLGRLEGTTFRIGHLGVMSPTMLLAVLSAVETGLQICGYRPAGSGVAATISELVRHSGEKSKDSMETDN